MRPLRAATRGSNLARRQTHLVGAALGCPIEPVVVSTLGDQRTDVPVSRLGGTGVFVKEVQAAVLDGRADFAVHSAKDLPSTQADGLVLAAVPERGDPRDVLVGRALDDLVAGARVGTGSVRRRAQLSWLRPDLTFGGLRGNLETRLEKAAGFAAIVVAAAALARLDRRAAAAQHLAPELMVPQAGQGALALECRAGDTRTQEALAAIDHAPSHRAYEAERAFLHTLGGGCDLPVGAYAVLAGSRLRLRAVLASPDGRVALHHEDEGEADDPVALARAVAAHLLDEAGGRSLLEWSGAGQRPGSGPGA